MWNLCRPALGLFVILSVVTGLAYPLAVTGLAGVLMPAQAAGSLMLEGPQVVGSRLIGQAFSAPGHFWGRPSATGGVPYHGGASGGSNLGPMNPVLLENVKARIAALRAADPGNTAAVPVDLVTASASGLDPHISPAAADYQVARVARVRGMAPGVLRELVARHTEGRQWGVLGEARVNVLALNRALERAARPAP